MGSTTRPEDQRLVEQVNAGLQALRHDGVLFVDCASLARDLGPQLWRDDRHRRMLRQPVAPAALPTLARALAGALAADLGLTARCLVVDLDGTLWSGVLGDDGVDGVRIDEPFAQFQEHLLGLRRDGLVLAVASKNGLGLAEQASQSS